MFFIILGSYPYFYFTGLLSNSTSNCLNADPFIIPTVPKISVLPATPDSNTFRKNIKNQNLVITTQYQNYIEDTNDNHSDSEVKNVYFI